MSIEVDTEQRPLPATPSAASGKRRKMSPECKAPTDEKAAPTQAKSAPASKALKPSKPAPLDLLLGLQRVLAEQSKKLADLKAKQAAELAACFAKQAAELAAFEATCKKEQVNASGDSKCAYCGTKVAGVVEKTEYSFQSLPRGIAETTCCFCQLTRKCKDCKWTVSCAYFPEEHDFCDDCENEANICWNCDGGCSKCQDDTGCCRTNGGRRRY